MNYKLETIEILENGKFIGYTPIFKWKGQKKKGWVEDGKPVLFDTRKEAKYFAMEKEANNLGNKIIEQNKR